MKNQMRVISKPPVEPKRAKGKQIELFLARAVKTNIGRPILESRIEYLEKYLQIKN